MNLEGKLIQAVGEAFSEGVALYTTQLFSLVPQAGGRRRPGG